MKAIEDNNLKLNADSKNKKDIDYNNKDQILQMVLKELDKKKVIKQEQSLKQVPRMI